MHTTDTEADNITSEECSYIRGHSHLKKCSSRKRKRKRETEKEIGREGDMIGRKARQRG